MIIDRKQHIKSKVEIDENGCWNWTGKIAKNGYGHITYPNKNDRKTYLIHRITYALFKSEIPIGMTIDHLCRNRKCCNPEHLEIVTSKENTLRGNGIAGINARKTHCIKNHPLSGNNLYITPDKRRNCKKCIRMSIEKYNDRKR